MRETWPLRWMGVVQAQGQLGTDFVPDLNSRQDLSICVPIDNTERPMPSRRISYTLLIPGLQPEKSVAPICLFRTAFDQSTSIVFVVFCHYHNCPLAPKTRLSAPP